MKKLFYGIIIILIFTVASLMAQQSDDYNPDDYLPGDEAEDTYNKQDDYGTYEKEEVKDRYQLEAERLENISKEALDNIKYNLIPITKKYKGIVLRVYKDKGFMIQLPNVVLFESGSDELKTSSIQILRDLRAAIMNAVNEETYLTITLYGHTDSDKRVGDPDYVIVPNTPKNRNDSGLAEYEDKGIDKFFDGKPYRLIPVSDKRYAIVSGEVFDKGAGYRESLNYNYCLGLDRAYIVHYNLFDTGDDDSDDNFSHFTNIQIIHNSYAFLKPIVSNLPLTYRSKEQEKSGKEKKSQNRRVEMWFEIWKEGINLKIENYRSAEQVKERQKMIEERRKGLNY